MTDQATPMPEADRAGFALRRIATIALAAVLLGFGMQAIILAATLAGRLSGRGVLVDLAQGVTWSLLVCSGIGVGTAIAKGRARLAGALSFLFAPVALAAAKGSQKAMSAWLEAPVQQAALPLGTMGVLRAVEYGLLGWLLARLVLRDDARPWPYLGAGFGIGVVLGGTITALTYTAALKGGAPMPQPKLIATTINEVVFPIGCALVIFLGQTVGRNLRLAEASGS